MRNATNTKIAALCTLILVVSFSPIRAQVLRAEANKPDEAYFLVRTLESLYEQWPQDISDPDAFTNAASDLRKEAIRLRVRAEEAALPYALVARYNDFVSLLDSYTEFLRNIGAIRKTARENAGKDNFTSGFNGGYAAAGTYGTLSQRKDVTSKDAALASLLVGGLTYAIDAWGKSGRRDEAERTAVTASAQKVQDMFTATLERTKESFQKLATEKGWDDREIGWDVSEAHAKAVLALYKEGNVPLLIQECSRQCSLRPKDPFIRLGRNGLQAISDQKDAQRLMRLAEDSRNAIELVPQDKTYLEYRLRCLLQAAMIATAGREVEKRNDATLRSSAASRRSLELWNEVLRLEPSDPTGYNRMYHAVARLDDGDVTGARSEADAVIQMLKSDSDCLYSYACILSMDKDYDNALQVLQTSLATGNVDLSDVRNDPDLLPLANNRKDQYAKLIIPQWSWTVTDDWLNDDVIVRNDSVYPLTNVVFSATLKRGDKTETLSLKCEKIPAGTSQKWANAVKAAGGAWESSSTANLSCDQGSK